MTDIASFSARLDLDEAAVRRVLESESSAAGRSMPWYVLLLLGLGAWITALIMIVFVAVFLDFVVGLDEPGLAKDAEVVRDRRLGEIEGRVQVADAGRARRREPVNDRNACRVSERLEDGGQTLGCTARQRRRVNGTADRLKDGQRLH